MKLVRTKNLLWQVSDSLIFFFLGILFPEFCFTVFFPRAVEWIHEPPSLQFFQTSKGKAAKEAWGGHLSGEGINVTFLHPYGPQLSAMCCVALNRIDPSFVICI